MVARTDVRVSSRRETSDHVQYGDGFTTGRTTRSGGNGDAVVDADNA